MREFHIDQRAPSKIYAQRDPMPEQHGKYTRHAEYQRKGEKIPLFPEKIYVWITKKFHAAWNRLSLLSRTKHPALNLQPSANLDTGCHPGGPGHEGPYGCLTYKCRIGGYRANQRPGSAARLLKCSRPLPAASGSVTSQRS